MPALPYCKQPGYESWLAHYETEKYWRINRLAVLSIGLFALLLGAISLSNSFPMQLTAYLSGSFLVLYVHGMMEYAYYGIKAGTRAVKQSGIAFSTGFAIGLFATSLRLSMPVVL